MSDQHPETDENKLIAQRRDKLQDWRERGDAFPNRFRRDAYAADLQAAHADDSTETLEADAIRVRVAGRMLAKRVMGKASFAQVRDMTGTIQLHVRRDALPEGVYPEFKTWDLGDIIGAEGTLFRTRAGELTISVDRIVLLTKSLRPLPEKYHGLADQEARYRQRYLDLIMNPEVRHVFEARSQVIQFIREFLNLRRFLEVETPMMQQIPGGAAARPFVTHHNALDMPLYLRIAPELFLKRLVVGGFEQVYEINRNFRNEGVSTRHNPEFTMLEFYQAYADYQDLMDLTETLLRELAVAVCGVPELTWQGEAVDLGKPFTRLTLCEAIAAYNDGVTVADLEDEAGLHRVAGHLGVDVSAAGDTGAMQLALFEETVEEKLRDPTFITDYPRSVSPLARPRDDNPDRAERFELFICGREMANGFSELNDPEDQAERFRAQAVAKDAGDQEAMHYDADYIRALEYGLPPTAGEGIGIDRLVMLFTDQASIRDVLLFPAMRPEA